MRATRRAYAKINLVLSVGPPLPPGDPRAGMHPIASWMHCIDLFDEVSIEPLEEGRASTLEVRWAADAPQPSPIDWPQERDLGFRALKLLEMEVGRPLPAAIRITKRIPVGGGLGGGSSDAAAVLAGVKELFGLDLGSTHLAELSRELGSDVGFFLDEGAGPARPAVVRGLGDRIERTAAVARGVVLILPRFGCATGQVYGAYDRLGAAALREDEVRAIAAAGDVDDARLFNDLAAPAEVVRPELRGLRERAMAAAGRPVHMTGSGSTLFVLAADGAGAAAMCGKLRAQLPEVVVVQSRLV